MEKNKTQRSKAVRWAALWILCILGFISFIVLAGEESPNNPMSLGEFFLIKLGGMASLLICFYVGKRLHRAGYLPDELDEDI